MKSTPLALLIALAGVCPLSADPISPVAEYEPRRGILLTWNEGFAVPLSFITQASARGIIWCAVRDPVAGRRAHAELAAAGQI